MKLFLGAVSFTVMYNTNEYEMLFPNREILKQADYAYRQREDGYWEFVKFRYDNFPKEVFFTVDDIHNHIMQYIGCAVARDNLRKFRLIDEDYGVSDAISEFRKIRHNFDGYSFIKSL